MTGATPSQLAMYCARDAAAATELFEACHSIRRNRDRTSAAYLLRSKNALGLGAAIHAAIESMLVQDLSRLKSDFRLNQPSIERFWMTSDFRLKRERYSVAATLKESPNSPSKVLPSRLLTALLRGIVTSNN